MYDKINTGHCRIDLKFPWSQCREGPLNNQNRHTFWWLIQGYILCIILHCVSKSRSVSRTISPPLPAAASSVCFPVTERKRQVLENNEKCGTFLANSSLHTELIWSALTSQIVLAKYKTFWLRLVTCTPKWHFSSLYKHFMQELELFRVGKMEHILNRLQGNSSVWNFLV